MNIQDIARSIISGGKNFIGGLVDEVYEAPILFGESLGKAVTSLEDRRSNKLLTDEALRLQQLSKNLPIERQQRIRKTALDLLTEAQGGYQQLAQEAQQYGQPSRVLPSAASTALTLFGAPVITKGGALLATGLGGLIGGLTGGNAAETAGRSLGSLPRTMGLVQFTSPAAQALGNKVGQSLQNIGAGLTGSQITSRGITGIGNVLEDEVLATANRRKTSTPEKITSFALGALLNPQANTDALQALKDYNNPPKVGGNPYHDTEGKFTTAENDSKNFYENLDNRDTRPLHQIYLEQAVNEQDYKRVGQILDKIPNKSDYKKSMESLFRKYVPKGQEGNIDPYILSRLTGAGFVAPFGFITAGIERDEKGNISGFDWKKALAGGALGAGAGVLGAEFLLGKENRQIANQILENNDITGKINKKNIQKIRYVQQFDTYTDWRQTMEQIGIRQKFDDFMKKTGGFKSDDDVWRAAQATKHSELPIGNSIKNVGSVDDLSKEARKYKSAEEFVRGKYDATSVSNSPEMIKYADNLSSDLSKLDRENFIASLPKNKKGEFSVDPKKELSKLISSFNKKYGTSITIEDWIGKKLPNRNDLLLNKYKSQLTDIWNKATKGLK